MKITTSALVLATGLLSSSLIAQEAPKAGDGKAPNDPKQAEAAKGEKIDIGAFAFALPAGFKEIKVQGIDSMVKKYESENIALQFDLGWYSDPLNSYEGRPDFKMERQEIGGKKAFLVTFAYPTAESGQPFGYVAAVHFPTVSKEGISTTRLTMWASCKTTKDYAVAKKIFQSITFKKKEKKD